VSHRTEDFNKYQVKTFSNQKSSSIKLERYSNQDKAKTSKLGSFLINSSPSCKNKSFESFESKEDIHFMMGYQVPEFLTFEDTLIKKLLKEYENIDMNDLKFTIFSALDDLK
jgi:hypothetical protein